MRFPDDPRARRVLEEYLGHYERGVAPCALQAEDLDLRGAVLDGLELQSAALHGAQMDGVSLRGTDLAGARLWGAKLREADLTGAAIVKTEFYGADATGATFDDLVYSTRAEFDDARLLGATFRRARLWEISFVRADLTGANFGNVILVMTTFREARLHQASFEGASGTILDRGAYLEEGPRAPVVAAEDLAKWMMAGGATDITVFDAPLLSSPSGRD